MKNAKFILLILIGVLLTCSFGCGGGASGVISSGGSSDEQISEAVSQLADKILAPNADGSPMIFDYAPMPESVDENAPIDPQGVHFVKYVSSADLNSDGEYVTAIHLNKDSEYVIKYSHGGRNLTNSLLGVRAVAPDGKEMLLDLVGFEVPELSEDIWTGEDLTEEEIKKLIAESGMTPEEIAVESSEETDTDVFNTPHYVAADIEILPAEDPCMVLYIFKAPMTGDYKFAVSELVVDSTDISVDRSPDVPFEFRIYNTAEAYSPSDGEEIDLEPRDILDIQRLLLSAAVGFNENGLPVEFETEYSEDNEQSEVETSALMEEIGGGYIIDLRGLRALLDDLIRKGLIIPGRRSVEEQLMEVLMMLEREWQEKLAAEKFAATHVIPAAVINDVPFDEEFALGAGFYAHSGLRATTKIIKNFSLPNGDSIGLNENFSAAVIATQEEHDRAQELGAMSNFAMLRYALGYTKRQDYARLGSDHTKVISVRYDLIEQQPRTPASNVFKIYDEAFEDYFKQKDGYKEFLRQFGDYFVAGYTYGTRCEAIVEIVIEPGKSHYLTPEERQKADEGRKQARADVVIYNYDPVFICNKAAETVQNLLKSVKENAVAERDTGKSNDAAKKRIEQLSQEIQKNFFDVTIKVSHCTRTGRIGELSFSLNGFADELASFIKSAKQTPRSQYDRLYVTFRRFREIEALKPYIPEVLDISRSLYDGIRRLTETVFRTRCYYNALTEITPSHLSGGTSLQDQWKNEFDIGLIIEMRGSLSRICDDEKLVAEYQAKSNALYEKYKALAERYNFYRYFVHVQKNASSPSWSTSDYYKDRTWERGFRSYDKSKLVQQDIKDGRSKRYHHKSEWTSGHKSATFSESFSKTHEYIIWFKTGHTMTNYSTGTDNNGKTIGRNHLSWTYAGVSLRRCEFFLEIQTVKLSPDLYPFAGLE